MRDYVCLPHEGLTFGVDIEKGFARVTVSACHDSEDFNSATGRSIVDLRLDKNDSTLRACSLKRNVVRFPYSGASPKIDILEPLIDFLCREINDRSFFRKLLFFLSVDMLSDEGAISMSKELDDGSIYDEFNSFMEFLDDEDRDALEEIESEEQLYKIFFSWEGSIRNISRRIKEFTTKVWKKEILLDSKLPEPLCAI